MTSDLVFIQQIYLMLIMVKNRDLDINQTNN